MTGLSSVQAETRLREVGPNALPEPRRESDWHRFLRQFKSPLIYILLAALVIDVGAWLGTREGFPYEAFAIAVILLLNAGLGTWQERKAARTLSRLQELSAPQAWVRRDGEFIRVATAELVPGDLVRLESGDRVPADGTAESAENLLLDESVLTGESLPVGRRNGEDLFAGTLAVRGHTLLLVTRTGAASTMGRLAGLLAEVREEPTPLERRLAVFGRRVAQVVLGIAVLIAVGGLAVEGLDQFSRVLLFAVALAVAAVPEGLPAVLTFALAYGVERMAKRRAVVRRLSAVEALGSVTVIATDKTGTLTENRMEVRAVEAPEPARALRAMVLANDAEPDTAAGDPLEVALHAWARAHGVEPERAQADAPRLSSRSFDEASRYMRVTVREGGRDVSYVKGAPEVVLARSSLSVQERARWDERVQHQAAQGLRTLGLAWGPGETEHDLTWLGLALLWDPPRPEVPDAIREARAAGIRVVMVTGDHPSTAKTIAESVGIDVQRVMTGAELERLAPETLRAAAREVTVFARTSPEHKLRLVEALQADGHVVAMTGDGVNDAPALKRADVGVAMGQRGSAVSREVADLVLTDDNFATIVAAVEEGRRIYTNVQGFIRFLFSTNLSEVLLVTIGFFLAFALDLRDAEGALLLPLTAAQLLWINLVTDGAPALALALDRTPGVMRRAPRPMSAPLLERDSLRFIAMSAGFKAACAFAILGVLPQLGFGLEETRTATFIFMAAGQLLFAYPARRTELVPEPNRVLHAAVVAGVLLQLPIMLLPNLREAFDVVPLPPELWAVVGLACMVSWAGAAAAGRVVWRRK